MNELENLILLYAGVVVLNAALSAQLWWQTRYRLCGIFFCLWASLSIALTAGQLLDHNDLALVLGFSLVFLANCSLAGLITRVISQRFRLHYFVGFLSLGYSLSVAAFALRLPFVFVSVPVAITAAAPGAYASVMAVTRRRGSLSFTGLGLVVCTLGFVAHNLDFPFLGGRPEYATMRITTDTVIAFALSSFALAVVLEYTFGKRTYGHAARVQAQILPQEPRLDGFDVRCYNRPVEAIGGDYYDVLSLPKADWILVGDVTGHGLAAGMVAVMAQSAIRTILYTHEHVTPRQLNYTTNQVLFKNLQRLHEQATMTIVAIRHDRESGECVVSGCHDDIYIFRVATGTVDTLEMVDFPFGLGFSNDTDEAQFHERRLSLASGDLLFIGTDGIAEAARRGAHELGTFGAGRVIACLERAGNRPLAAIESDIVQALEEFTAGAFHDDIAFVLARVAPIAAQDDGSRY